MGGQTSRKERAGAESYSTQRTAKNRTCRQKNREDRQQRQGKAGGWRSREGEGEGEGGRGWGKRQKTSKTAKSEGVEEAKADKSGKIKGSRAGGWKMDAKNGWFQNGLDCNQED